MNIKNYVEDKKRALSEIEKEIETSTLELKDLLEDPKVKEYFSKKEELKNKKEILLKTKKEYDEAYQEKCNHPLWSLITKRNIYYPYNDSKELECVICKKHTSSYFSLDDLYNKKKLIAYRKLERDCWEGRSWFEYEPLYSSEEIEKYYYDLYLNLEKLKKQDDGSIIPKHFNIEETVWNYFCNNNQNNTKTKVIQNI